MAQVFAHDVYKDFLSHLIATQLPTNYSTSVPVIASDLLISWYVKLVIGSSQFLLMTKQLKQDRF